MGLAVLLFSSSIVVKGIQLDYTGDGNYTAVPAELMRWIKGSLGNEIYFRDVSKKARYEFVGC